MSTFETLTRNNSSQRGKTWFITGTSSGFGFLLAKYLISLGANVVATARRADVLEELEASAPAQVQRLALDVTKPAQIDAAVKDALARWGKIDVLVNNAGYGLTAAFEEAHEDEYRPMFETNVFGLIQMTQALLPHFRERRTGNILFLSSIGGLVGLPGWAFYNSTKFAIEGLGEALGAELEPLGIDVTIVEPGPFRTEFLGTSGKKSQKTIADYEQTAGKTRAYMEAQNGKQAGDPQKAVEAMVAAVSAPKSPRHLVLGALAYNRFQQKLTSFQDEMSQWKEVTFGADFPGVESANPYK
ncbi:oxidoreductase [Granulicella cerasi]|uniref:Oxidoreductase n=1 Tax=Granulicella cerasi TaxID=741063 RepID=A0ABW1Z9F4_9BACT|nr:oxidoreductase [Granulicella cerasi]